MRNMETPRYDADMSVGRASASVILCMGYAMVGSSEDPQYGSSILFHPNLKTSLEETVKTC